MEKAKQNYVIWCHVALIVHCLHLSWLNINLPLLAVSQLIKEFAQKINGMVRVSRALIFALLNTGATFIPVRVHSSSLLWLCIGLRDMSTKSHNGATHTGASLPW